MTPLEKLEEDGGEERQEAQGFAKVKKCLGVRLVGFCFKARR